MTEKSCGLIWFPLRPDTCTCTCTKYILVHRYRGSGPSSPFPDPGSRLRPEPCTCTRTCTCTCTDFLQNKRFPRSQNVSKNRFARAPKSSQTLAGATNPRFHSNTLEHTRAYSRSSRKLEHAGRRYESAISDIEKKRFPRSKSISNIACSFARLL